MECGPLPHDLCEKGWRTADGQHEALPAEEGTEPFLVATLPPLEDLLYVVNQQQDALVLFGVVACEALEAAVAHRGVAPGSQVSRQSPKALQDVLFAEFRDNTE